jgi:presenilin 1
MELQNMTQQSEPETTRRRNTRSNSQASNQQPNASAGQTRRMLTEEELDELNIKHNAGHVIQIFIPVSICMFVAVILLKWFDLDKKGPKDVQTIYAPLKETEDMNTGTLALTALGNAAIFAVFICCMTFFMFFLYKYKCELILKGWIFFTIIAVMFTLSATFFTSIISHFNWPVDVISFVIFCWNFGVLGVMAVLYKAPKRLNQAYLIVIGVSMALVFISLLPEWTTWAVLAVISGWDLIAVLCKYGPLKMLVEEAQARGNTEILPALIYSAMAYEERVPKNGSPEENTPLSDGTSGNESDSPQTTQPRSTTMPAGDNRTQPVYEIEEEEDETGVKLGLGDFIFYSVLVGKAAILGDWTVTFGCYTAILVGLAATLVCLAVTRKALPALPFSICLGLIAYFAGEYLVKPFLDEITLRQIML